MKTTKKALLALVCAVALVFGSVFATYAYLTSTTDTVTNTFTVGKVEITLDEEDVDGSETTVTTEGRDIANEYQMIPGKTYVKDPTVTVSDDSDDCWLFVTFKESNNALDNGKIIVYENNWDGWTKLKEENGTVIYYREVLKADADRSWVLLTENEDEEGNPYNIEINEALSNETMPESGETPSLEFKAYAIQKDGFNTAEQAWEELN